MLFFSNLFLGLSCKRDVNNNETEQMKLNQPTKEVTHQQAGHFRTSQTNCFLYEICLQEHQRVFAVKIQHNFVFLDMYFDCGLLEIHANQLKAPSNTISLS